jgi:hypothetical protein
VTSQGRTEATVTAAGCCFVVLILLPAAWTRKWLVTVRHKRMRLGPASGLLATGMPDTEKCLPPAPDQHAGTVAPPSAGSGPSGPRCVLVGSLLCASPQLALNA